MLIDFDFITNAVTLSVETIAMIEAIKVFFKKKSFELPSWIYTLLSTFFSFGLALIQSNSFAWVDIKGQIPIGLLAFSISQLGYDSIWKLVQKKITEAGNE